MFKMSFSRHKTQFILIYGLPKNVESHFINGPALVLECISVPDRNLPSQLPKVKTLKKESNLYHFGAPKPKTLRKIFKIC